MVVICDPRMVARSYGRVFLAALPPMSVTQDADEVLRFLARHAPRQRRRARRRAAVKILALDTATENCSVALLVDGAADRARAAARARSRRAASCRWSTSCSPHAGVSLRQLAAIAFGRGPGAFTGVRLAASVTQGLAFGAALPVVPVSDLRALAQRVLS